MPRLAVMLNDEVGWVFFVFLFTCSSSHKAIKPNVSTPEVCFQYSCVREGRNRNKEVTLKSLCYLVKRNDIRYKQVIMFYLSDFFLSCQLNNLL